MTNKNTFNEIFYAVKGFKKETRDDKIYALYCDLSMKSNLTQNEKDFLENRISYEEYQKKENQ